MAMLAGLLLPTGTEALIPPLLNCHSLWFHDPQFGDIGAGRMVVFFGKISKKFFQALPAQSSDIVLLMATTPWSVAILT